MTGAWQRLGLAPRRRMSLDYEEIQTDEDSFRAALDAAEPPPQAAIEPSCGPGQHDAVMLNVLVCRRCGASFSIGGQGA